MKRSILTLAALSACVFGLGAVDAADKPVPVFQKKIGMSKLKLFLTKIDPEIRGAQKSLLVAKARLNAALKDEVFQEKGSVEGEVIDQLKLALKHVDLALKATNKAQVFDKGGD